MVDIGLIIEGHEGLTWPRWQRILRTAEDAGFAFVLEVPAAHLLISDAGRALTDLTNQLAPIAPQIRGWLIKVENPGEIHSLCRQLPIAAGSPLCLDPGDVKTEPHWLATVRNRQYCFGFSPAWYLVGLVIGVPVLAFVIVKVLGWAGVL